MIGVFFEYLSAAGRHWCWLVYTFPIVLFTCSLLFDSFFGMDINRNSTGWLPNPAFKTGTWNQIGLQCHFRKKPSGQNWKDYWIHCYGGRICSWGWVQFLQNDLTDQTWLNYGISIRRTDAPIHGINLVCQADDTEIQTCEKTRWWKSYWGCRYPNHAEIQYILRGEDSLLLFFSRFWSL